MSVRTFCVEAETIEKRAIANELLNTTTIMIQKITILLSCFLMVACAEKKKLEIPANVLSKEKMTAVMVDVHLLEATMGLNTFNADHSNPEDPAPTFSVFSRHNTDKQQYDSSFVFYSYHPDLFSEIYQDVLENLSKMQAEVMNVKNASIIVADSASIE